MAYLFQHSEIALVLLAISNPRNHFNELGVITFSPHQLLVIVNMPPRPKIITKREH
jgi:hypothetical protein